MRTYRDGTGGRGLALLALAVCVASPLIAQERRYLVELGAAGAFQSFASDAQLSSGVGGLVRGGVWLPLNFSVEGEAAFTNPKAKTTDEGVKVTSLTLAALYNIPIGNRNWFYLKAGGGAVKYGGDCPTTASAGPVICGRPNALVG